LNKKLNKTKQDWQLTCQSRLFYPFRSSRNTIFEFSSFCFFQRNIEFLLCWFDHHHHRGFSPTTNLFLFSFSSFFYSFISFSSFYFSLHWLHFIFYFFIFILFFCFIHLFHFFLNFILCSLHFIYFLSFFIYFYFYFQIIFIINHSKINQKILCSSTHQVIVLSLAYLRVTSSFVKQFFKQLFTINASPQLPSHHFNFVFIALHSFYF